MARSERQVRLAVAWWVEALRKPADGPPEPAGPSETEGLAAILGSFIEPDPRPDEARIEVFAGHLARLMGEEPHTIYNAPATDYYPGGVLREALELAGIDPKSMTLLPQKTFMLFEGDDVYVRQPGKADVKLE